MTEAEFIKKRAREINAFACQYKMALQRAYQAGYDDGSRAAAARLAEYEAAEQKARDAGKEWADRVLCRTSAPAAPGEEAKG